ncbi:MAG: SDR family oxidoreductase [Bacteroidetes bacterium]|nr:SDR family oxidoreductase [Bacteroidota bacterium]
MDYQNKTIVITGGAKGIGAATAKLFFDSGANVVILDVAPDTSDIKDNRWLVIHCDVSDESQVQSAFQHIEQQFQFADYLVNNAGIQRYGTVTATTIDEWDLVMNVNLKSFFLCSKYALPLMQKKNVGVIINVASVQAFLSQQNVAAYTTAKSAILGLTRSIAVDYAPGIRCVAVCPGTIDTPMLRDSIALSPDPDEVMQECVDMHLTKRIGTPDEVASLIFYLCDDKAAFITGQAIRIDGGLGITIQGSKR